MLLTGDICANICHTANNCGKCDKLKSQLSKWTSWPVLSQAWQRIRAEYCGPFFGECYALVVIDPFSTLCEDYFTTSSNFTFTNQSLRKVCSREMVPMVSGNLWCEFCTSMISVHTTDMSIQYDSRIQFSLFQFRLIILILIITFWIIQSVYPIHSLTDIR